MVVSDFRLVVEFLRGRTFRELDALLGYDVRRTNGKRAWLRIKRFPLRKEDRGTLFVFAQREVETVAREVIAAGSRAQVEAVLAKAWPRKLRAFQGVVVQAPDDRVFRSAVSGVFRNVTNAFFAKRRRSGACQRKGCAHAGVLHTAHLREERPAILGRVSRQCAAKRSGGGYEFPLDRIARRYLEEHRRKGSVAFLCPVHHRQQEQAAKRGSKAARAHMRNLLP